VAEELQLGRRAPGFLEDDVLEAIAHQLADARNGIDVRDDLQQEVRLAQALQHRLLVRRAVLVAERAERAQRLAIVQGADAFAGAP
jgi:hypothetical protein